MDINESKGRVKRPVTGRAPVSVENMQIRIIKSFGRI